MEIAFLTSFRHEVHMGFADTIGADLMDFRETYSGRGESTPVGDVIAGAKWPKYDAYIIEGSAPLYAAAGCSLLHDSPVIYLGGDRGMFALQRAGGKTSRSSTAGKIVERLGPSLSGQITKRVIDGAIVVSNFIADYTMNMVGPNTPIRVVNPYIEQSLFNSLESVSPSLSENTAVTVARAMDYKGVDQLVKAWPEVRSNHEDAELYIVGPGEHSKEYESTPGVTVLGFVEDLEQVFEKSSLFVQPSRGDAFAISSVEAMRAGLPALVTLQTGARSEAGAVSNRFVVDSDKISLAKGIVSYFDLPIDKRKEYSDAAIARTARFDERTKKAEFEEAFEDILERVC